MPSYFNNTDLSGAPVLQQNISSVNFNWGYGSPGPQVNVDNFSARYQRTQQIATGTYRVTTSSDDGVRVSIDNVLVIDNWNVQPVTTVSQDVIIMNGNHQITIEYFEATELAETSLLPGEAVLGNVCLRSEPWGYGHATRVPKARFVFSSIALSPAPGAPPSRQMSATRFFFDKPPILP